MTIKFTARRAVVTPDVKKYCEKRLLSLEKILGSPLDANLILTVEKYRNKIEIIIRTKGTTLNAVSETQDLFNSLGIAFDHIERRIKKEKTKSREKKRRRSVEIPLPAAFEQEEPRKKIIKSRSYTLKPMSVNEAASLLESRKDEVFVFPRVDSGQWAVLFRRKDGHFGLVEPE